jgi:hypothetical protein
VVLTGRGLLVSASRIDSGGDVGMYDFVGGEGDSGGGLGEACGAGGGSDGLSTFVFRSVSLWYWELRRGLSC